MLSSQLPSPSLDWRIAIPRSLILLIILHFVDGVNVAAQQLWNLSIPITSPQILYTPFTCNASTTLANPRSCSGAWRLSDSSANVPTISTTGPSSASGNIIPQVFFEFQASALLLTASRPSNASVNLTLSAGGRNVSSIFNSSLRSISIVDLPQSQTTLLTITYIPTAASTLFGLQSLVITVPTNASVSSILPTPTLPPSISLPTFIPTTSSSSTVATTTIVMTVNSNKKMIAEAVGITIGLGLGLTVSAVAAFYYWKRRRQRRYTIRVEEAQSEWSRDG